MRDVQSTTSHIARRNLKRPDQRLVEAASGEGPNFSTTTGRPRASGCWDPAHKTLLGALLHTTRACPSATAIIYRQHSFSFAWLEGLSGRMAAGLIGAGVKQGDVVGLHLTRSADMVAAMVAVLRVGAAYLPLDPDFPAERLSLIVEDAQPAVIISEQALQTVLETSAPRLDLDYLRGTEAAAQAFPVVEAGDLAYVLYTSGSTGKPKGVEITHGAVLNLLRSFIGETGFEARDRMLASTTTAFDISVLEIFMPLVSGASLVLADGTELKDPHALAKLVDLCGCTFAQATPSKWRYLIEAGWTGGDGLTLLSGGEALSRELADLLLTRCRRLWNVYGPTETTVWSTCALVKPGLDPPSIGWPILNTSLHVLGPAGRSVASGEVGELFIGGAGLARGYRRQPELTAERFVEFHGERLYRTGDLASIRPDGALECLGRTDDQVKVRGYRVELGEVEAALTACDNVAFSAVVARNEEGETELVGYVVGLGGHRLDPLHLRQGIGRRLPAYMVPTRFIQLDAMPLTPNGKLDRKALPPPEQDERPKARDTVALTATEERLVGIWQDILGVRPVSPLDNFFDLGGYSRLILKLFRRIEEVFGRSLTMADLFAATDLRTMAALLDTPPAEPVSGGLIPLQPLGERPPLIWFDVGPQLMPLAQHMAPHQPFIGLNLEGRDTQDLDGVKIDTRAVARELLRLLKLRRPVGPYYLGGWCRWGVMAFEAARLLQEGGEDVRLLVMLDSANRMSLYQRTKRLARGALQTVGMKRPDPETAQPPMLALTTQVEAASLCYRPPPYRGDVLLLTSRDGEPDIDGCSGWKAVVEGELSVYRSSTDHAGILQEPHVRAIGDVLLASLVRAHDRGGASPRK